MVELKLANEWQERLKLRADAKKLDTESDEFIYGKAKLNAEGLMTWGKGQILRGEAEKLKGKGDSIWGEAILANYGNIAVELMWSGEHREYSCRLENGDTYGFKD